MSKIGQLPVQVPKEVTIDISNQEIKVTGPKGNLSFKFDKTVEVVKKEDELIFKSDKNTKWGRSIWGTTRKIVDNMVKGVTQGWSKQLELVGTGYRAEVQGKTPVLTVGYSHPTKIEAPEGISFKVEKGIVTVEGIDRHMVGQVSANIRASRPPEPYKGKGVKFVGEVIRRKAGKAAKAAA